MSGQPMTVLQISHRLAGGILREMRIHLLGYPLYILPMTVQSIIPTTPLQPYHMMQLLDSTAWGDMMSHMKYPEDE